ncbi:MAG: hypothetical protein ACSLE0_19705 [Chitinophagaceae bacterium]
MNDNVYTVTARFGGARNGGMMGKGMHGNRGMMGNQSSMGGMMQMPHPVHIHQLQFNILKRNAEKVDRNL